MDDDDIVAALRRGEDGWEYAAADEIEALRAENAKLRAQIVELDTRSRRERCKSTFGYTYDKVIVDEIAERKALGEAE